MVHSVQLEFGVDLTGHRHTICVDFGGYRAYHFYVEIKKKKRILILMTQGLKLF